MFHREEYGDEMRQLNDGLEKFKIQCHDEVRRLISIHSIIIIRMHANPCMPICQENPRSMSMIVQSVWSMCIMVMSLCLDGAAKIPTMIIYRESNRA